MLNYSSKTTGIINFLDLKNIKVKVPYWLVFFLLLVVAFICFAPPVWIILSSLKDIQEFYAVPPTIIPKTFELHKLVDAWNLMNFGRFYINTFEVVAGTVLFSVFFNSLAGYVLSRLKPRGSKLLFYIMMWTMMIPTTVSMIPRFRNFVKMPILHVNLLNTYWPLWLLAGCSAFFVLVFKSFFDSIPMTYLEAARMDGYGDFSIFFKIIIPLSKPVIFAVVIFTLNNTWGDFFWPFLTLNDRDKFTIIVRLYEMSTSDVNVSQDLIMAAITFAIIPPAVLFIIFQKYIMQGFTLGGIKG